MVKRTAPLTANLAKLLATAATRSHGQRCGLKYGAQRKTALHLRHTRQARKMLAVYARKVVGVLGDDFEQIIR